MLPVLESLIALQALDTAAEAARRRLVELPAAEQALDREIGVAETKVEAAKALLAANQHSRRELEKQVAGVDTRLARFDDHKSAVKTNQEYTALLHEISTAKSEKDGFEEQILVLMEAADGMSLEVTEQGRVLTGIRQAAEVARGALHVERGTLEVELARLLSEKTRQASGIAPAVLAKYEQLLKQRKMIAVAVMRGDICMACHVRLRPAFTQQVRRNAEILACDSCQRILYFVPEPAATDAAAAPAQPAPQT